MPSLPRHINDFRCEKYAKITFLENQQGATWDTHNHHLGLLCFTAAKGGRRVRGHEFKLPVCTGVVFTSQRLPVATAYCNPTASVMQTAGMSLKNQERSGGCGWKIRHKAECLSDLLSVPVDLAVT